MGQRQEKQGSRRIRAFALILLLFATKLHAQLPDLRVGQEVQIHTDSTKKTVTGKVNSITAAELGIVRTLDAPPIYFPWYDVVSIDVRSGDDWSEFWRNPGLKGMPRGPALTFSDSSWMAGNLAGAKVADDLRRGGYFAPAFLSGAAIGFAWIFTVCDGCNIVARLAAPAGVAGISLTASRARKDGNHLPVSIAQQVDGMPIQYQAGFREGYRKRMSSKSTREIVGGSIVGVVTGFALLLGAFAATYAD
jgi:hypothetical protein